MSKLLIVAFDNAEGAADLNAALEELRKTRKLETRDVNIVTRDSEGELHLRYPVNIPLMQTLGGGVWGLVLGAVFLLPLAGAAIGAGVGALIGHQRGAGLDASFTSKIGDALKPGGSALCLWVDEVNEPALMRVIDQFDQPGTVVVSPLPPEMEARMQRLLDGEKARDETGPGEAAS